MAVTIVPFKCPSCGKIDHEGTLIRWMKVGDIELHACLECQENGMTEEQLLRVAIKAGWDAARHEQQRCDRQFKEPDMGETSPFLKWRRDDDTCYGEWV
jgi:hypothetical protein